MKHFEKRMFVVLLFLAVASAQLSVCQWKNPFNGNLYDISQLYNPIVDYFAKDPMTAASYFINPCFGLVNTSRCASGCTVCQESSIGVTNCVGNTNTLEFSSATWAGDGVTATWTAGLFTVDIAFICSPSSGIGFPTFVVQNPTKTFTFAWKSFFACGVPPLCEGNNCQSCLNGTGSGCSWCLDTNSCQSSNSTSGCSNRLINPKFCPAYDCSQFSDSCSDCVSSSNSKYCSWCLDSQTCVSNSDQTCDDIINNPKYCSLRH